MLDPAAHPALRLLGCVTEAALTPVECDVAREHDRLLVRIVTTNLLVGETHALPLHRAGRSAALQFAQTVRAPPILVVASSSELEREAVTHWLSRFIGEDLTLADAVSSAVMRRRKIREALTLDGH